MDLAQAQRAFRKLAELGMPGSVTSMLVGVEYAQLHQATPAQLLKLDNLLEQQIANNRSRRKEIAAFEEAAVEPKAKGDTKPKVEPKPAPKPEPTPKPPRKRKRKSKAKAKAKVAPAPKPVVDPTKPKNKGGRPQRHKWDNAWLCSLADNKANIYQTSKELGVSRQALHARVQLAVAERNDQAKADQEQAFRNCGPNHTKELWLIEVWTPKCGTVTVIKPFWTRAAADKFMEEQAHYYAKPPRIVRFVPAEDP